MSMKKLLNPPFRLIISGYSGSGKTTLLINILKHYAGTFDNVFVFCPTYYYQPIWHTIALDQNKIFTEYTDKTLAEITSSISKCSGSNLIIFDDCGAEKIKHSNYKNPLDELVFNCRHIGLGTSMIFTCQNLTQLSTSIRNNSEGVIIFETSNKYEKKMLYTNFGIGSEKDFAKLLNYCTRNEPHSFMFINKQTHPFSYHKKFRKLIISNI